MSIPVKEPTERLPSVMPAEMAIAMFDEEARLTTGLSGEEFIRRYDAGEFRDYEDDAEGRELMHLIMLMPFGRQKS
jgi:hypothetical protein